MYLFDTFTNFLSGLGVVGRDKMTAFHYSRPLWTREQLEAAFTSDWIARKAIAIPAQDATREWRAWQAKAEQIELIEETENRLQIQLKLQLALTKSRLYGGCCMLIGVEGDMASELDPETIKKDGLKFVHILAPHQLVIEEMVKDIADPYYGQPLFYTVYDDTQKFGKVNIHPSRMVRLVGMDVPDPMQNFGWGDPVMQMIHDAVSAAGTVTQSVAAMIGEAKFDVIKIPGLTEIFSTTDGTNRLVKRFSEANVAKSVINAVVLDAEEEWERIGVNFGGMPEILQMYLQIAAGAADIPATRFLGRSPTGLNATGDSDLINYYDRIASDQMLRLSPALEVLDKAIIRSALGASDPDIYYEWNSLWQTTEAEKATIAKQKADAAKVDVDTGLVPFTALVKGRCNQLVEDGTYPGLEAAIAEAEAAGEMPEESPAMIMMAKQAENDLAAQGEDDAPFGKKPPPKKKANGNGKYADSGGRGTVIPFDDRRGWDEDQHPRDEDGKFASGSETIKGSRAPKGGGIAEANKYFYKGGQFLPITEAPPGTWRIKVKGKSSNLPNGAEQVEPGKREGRPTPFSRSVYSVMGAGAEVDVDLTSGKASLNQRYNWDYAGTTPNEKRHVVFKNLASSKETYSTNDLIELYNRGVRWIDLEPNEGVEVVAKSETPLPGGDPVAEAMTREEIKRHNELEEKYESLNELERQEFDELEKKFELRWKLQNEKWNAEKAAELEAENEASLKKIADSVARDLGFDPDRIVMTRGTRTFEVNGVKHTAAGDADIYNKEGTGVIRLYTEHLDMGNVKGVAAHEVEHFKFEDALKAYREDSAAMRADPGPDPDPTHERWYGKKGGTSAMMTPDGALRPPYDKKYPYYTALHDALYAPPMEDFANGDGVSKYSAEYWKGWKGGQINTEIALHETLAEMAKAKYLTGKFPEHFGYSPVISERKQAAPSDAPDYVEKQPNKARGTKVWRDLFKAVDRIHKQRSKKQ